MIPSNSKARQTSEMWHKKTKKTETNKSFSKYTRENGFRVSEKSLCGLTLYRKSFLKKLPELSKIGNNNKSQKHGLVVSSFPFRTTEYKVNSSVSVKLVLYLLYKRGARILQGLSNINFSLSSRY